jgi:uncharacterized cupin superfamily protein
MSMTTKKPVAAINIEASTRKSLYPEPFASMMKGRTKRKLGDYFALTNFGINLTELKPGAVSALKHHHLTQDEFIYILNGRPTLVFGNNEYLMRPGDCFGFKKGQEIGSQLVNNSNEPVVYLEIGDRSPGDEVEYPDNDMCAKSAKDGSWLFLHKDGTPY